MTWTHLDRVAAVIALLDTQGCPHLAATIRQLRAERTITTTSGQHHFVVLGIVDNCGTIDSKPHDPGDGVSIFPTYEEARRYLNALPCPDGYGIFTLEPAPETAS